MFPQTHPYLNMSGVIFIWLPSFCPFSVLLDSNSLGTHDSCQALRLNLGIIFYSLDDTFSHIQAVNMPYSSSFRLFLITASSFLFLCDHLCPNLLCLIIIAFIDYYSLSFSCLQSLPSTHHLAFWCRLLFPKQIFSTYQLADLYIILDLTIWYSAFQTSHHIVPKNM